MMMRLAGFKELVCKSVYFTLQKEFNFSVDIQKAFQEQTFNTQKENNKCEHRLCIRLCAKLEIMQSCSERALN